MDTAGPSAGVAMVIKARNEEEYMAKALESIKRQTLRPYRTIVVNDGSTDNTASMVSEFKWVERVDMPEHESYLARKELAGTINAGLDLLRDDDACRYVCLGDADTLYPENYLRVVISRMEEDPLLAVTSGVIQGEFSSVPRETGRVVNCKFWRKIGFRYPVNYGYATYLLFKADSMGYRNAAYEDLVMTTQRKTGGRFRPPTYRYYGVAMNALGYRHMYALARAILFFRKNPAGAIHMLRGYCSKYDYPYEADLQEYVRKMQTVSNYKLVKFFKMVGR